MMLTPALYCPSKQPASTGRNDVHPLRIDSRSWCFETNVPDGLKQFVRKAISGGVEGDFETGNMGYKEGERAPLDAFTLATA